MKLKIILIVFLLITPVLSHADESDPAAKASAFLKMVQEGKTSEAYDQLFVGSSIPVSKPQAVKMLKVQTDNGLLLHGDIIGFEKVREEEFGTSVVRLVYISKAERSPIIWEFYFYKPKSDWFLANIMFNDQFQLLEAKQ